MANINNNLEYINQMARDNPAGLVAATEQRYNNITANIAKRALSCPGHKLVMLAGPSASGKTTTAQKLAEALQVQGMMAYRVSLDDFYLEREHLPKLPDGTPDIESVHALDLELLRNTLRDLMETGRGEIPHFDFACGRRSRFDTLVLGENDMIVLEGLHALNPEITQICPCCTKVYINVSSRIYNEKREIVLDKRSLRLTRRILRDSQFRGSSAEQTLAMWPAVTQGEDHYLAPCKQFADILVNAIHIYEPCVFAARVLPLLDEIPGGSLYAKQARRLAVALRCFEPLPEIQVPADSLLREFLG